jgi:hypothetical protein
MRNQMMRNQVMWNQVMWNQVMWNQVTRIQTAGAMESEHRTRGESDAFGDFRK